jgi:hypothetical protein
MPFADIAEPRNGNGRHLAPVRIGGEDGSASSSCSAIAIPELFGWTMFRHGGSISKIRFRFGKHIAL